MQGELSMSGPLVSFILLCYRQESFVQDAVQAALSQDYDNLEIIISDDCSPDSTYEVIESEYLRYSGSHEVVINRNASNLGLAAHFNAMLARARGEIIVVAAGDDISLSHRVSDTVKIFSANPGVMAVSFSDIRIDASGEERRPLKGRGGPVIVSLDDFLKRKGYPLSAASRGFRREVYSTFGALNDRCPTEDTPFLLRSLMLGDIFVSHAPGIKYRIHGENLSGHNLLSRMNFEEIRCQYLSDIEVGYLCKKISRDQRLVMEGWVERNYKERLFFRTVYEKKGNVWGALLFIVFVGGVDFYSRLRAFKLLFG